MGACVDSLLECGVVVLVGLGIGLAANAAGDDGLDLRRDYFPHLGVRAAGDDATTSDATPGHAPAVAKGAPAGDPATAAHAESDDVFAPPHVLARLEEHGLQAMLFEDARATFEDPLRTYGAYVFIDARQEDPYDEGHVPGAYLFDRYRPERYLPEVTALLATSQRIVVYCNGGECEDSEYAADFLMQFGALRESLFVFVGGIAEWKARGMPIERGARDSGVLEEHADG